MMEVLLDTPQVKIEVDCAANYEVCGTCGGTGTTYTTILPFDSGHALMWFGLGYYCRGCAGRGFWKKRTESHSRKDK